MTKNEENGTVEWWGTKLGLLKAGSAPKGETPADSMVRTYTQGGHIRDYTQEEYDGLLAVGKFHRDRKECFGKPTKE